MKQFRPCYRLSAPEVVDAPRTIMLEFRIGAVIARPIRINTQLLGGCDDL